MQSWNRTLSLISTAFFIECFIFSSLSLSFSYFNSSSIQRNSFCNEYIEYRLSVRSNLTPNLPKNLKYIGIQSKYSPFASTAFCKRPGKEYIPLNDSFRIPPNGLHYFLFVKLWFKNVLRCFTFVKPLPPPIAFCYHMWSIFHHML